jgi:hypothetical protein
MAGNSNFLLGYGERLTQKILHTSGGGEKSHPYTFAEAQERLVPRVLRTIQSIEDLPSKACPEDKAVVALTLHPAYIAKSHYPDELLQAVGVEAVGSRASMILPEKVTRRRVPVETVTTELFVAGSRRNLRAFARSLGDWNGGSPGAKDIRKIEDFRAIGPEERVMRIAADEETPLLEIVLHASGSPRWGYVVDGFRQYLQSLGISGSFDRRFYAGGLCFLPVRLPRALIGEVARFSFLRVARGMPRLRQFHPPTRSFQGISPFELAVPTEAPIDPELRVAVIDGGVPQDNTLHSYVTLREGQGIGPPVDDDLAHGLGVTSALLFGPLREGVALPVPYAHVDHYRVLDEDCYTLDADDAYHVVLKRVQDILQSRRYQFLNLSIGPDLPIEDNEVHAWTAVLDELLSDGQTLASIAAGNGGANDWDSGNARIQSPADCVNGFAVGATDTTGTDWRRASYSCIGPGRSPGLVKPDALAFGGSSREPFWVVGPDISPTARPTMGTSFAAPTALRTALGIRAHFGPVLSPIAVKGLLVNQCRNGGHLHQRECGWGRICDELADITVCDDCTVRVVYQGELSPAQWLRIPIPIPYESIAGKVDISATFCFITTTDPHNPVSYTRSGLDVVFRPNDKKRKKENQADADSKPFFQTRDYMSETELREDAHKWETTLHKKLSMFGSGLSNPVFDIHYNAREGGAATRGADKIVYSLVLTIRAPEANGLYDNVLKRYRTQLEPLRPIVELPVTVSL